jgi:hypothetical protein
MVWATDNNAIGPPVPNWMRFDIDTTNWTIFANEDWLHRIDSDWHYKTGEWQYPGQRGDIGPEYDEWMVAESLHAQFATNETWLEQEGICTKTEPGISLAEGERLAQRLVGQPNPDSYWIDVRVYPPTLDAKLGWYVTTVCTTGWKVVVEQECYIDTVYPSGGWDFTPFARWVCWPPTDLFGDGFGEHGWEGIIVNDTVKPVIKVVPITETDTTFVPVGRTERTCVCDSIPIYHSHDPFDGTTCDTALEISHWIKRCTCNVPVGRE